MNSKKWSHGGNTMMQKHRVGLATAMACIVMVALAYLNAMPVRLTPEQEEAITAPYGDQYMYLFDVKATNSVLQPNLLVVRFKGQLSHDQWPERVEVRYDRTSQAEIASRHLTGRDTLLTWGLNLTAVLALAVVGGLYLIPAVAGHYCPHCRRSGIFPVLLRPIEKELYPPTWASDGGLWPPIYETEWTCPSCDFREYSVRRPAQQGDDANILKQMLFSLSSAKAQVNPYVSDGQLQKVTASMAEEMTEKGITREEYDRRWAEARRSASERSRSRE